MYGIHEKSASFYDFGVCLGCMQVFSRFPYSLVLFLVFFGGVALILSLPRESVNEQNQQESEVTHTPGLSPDASLEGEGVLDDEGSLYPGYYTLFSLNVHDWSRPNESIATIARLLDVHETYGVPVDIYFTDPVFRNTLTQSPELIDRLRNSSVATVAYHIRPPVPYYPGFDWYGLEALSREELYDVLSAYETHALDLETGGYTDDPGGYAYVAEVMGYAPPSVGVLPGGKVGSVLAQVYADLGNTFAVVHGKRSLFGDRFSSSPLYIRPEDVDVKIYEEVDRTQDGGAVLEAYMQEAQLERPYFLGIKYHEDNFYSVNGTSWWEVYFSSREGLRREGIETPRTPPFPLEHVNAQGRLQTEEERARDWALYESAVQYVAEHPEKVTPLNLFILRDLLQK